MSEDKEIYLLTFFCFQGCYGNEKNKVAKLHEEGMGGFLEYTCVLAKI